MRIEVAATADTVAERRRPRLIALLRERRWAALNILWASIGFSVLQLPLHQPAMAQSRPEKMAVAAVQHPLFKMADVALGEKLIEEHKCAGCHARRVGGDGSDIYQPTGRINDASKLRGMVEYCNTELNLGFFPEDTDAVAAALNLRHYKFR